ncbi:DUF6000 family protein [Catellatospora chokoriensis]|uniref:Uncharacterized protein n=1 Tax=Catellatospora chokoriensis TaxID=310353 RepID=A0A8J3NT80_9ACTN|nr:DUF6000 family protein [Catellatospora chokoriensis]GIF91378.1 hypothetical protein Cch02nite_48220 [Catellatospora chokoriensis]
MHYLPPLADPGVDTIRRYVIVTPPPEPPRYLELMRGRHKRRAGPEADAFLSALRKDAQTISDEELTFLLQPGRRPNWRPRLVAGYLVGISRRGQFRQTIGDLLLASEVFSSGQGYCFALAALGSDRDAELLTAYLDRYLPRPDLRYDQAWAMGALVHLDTQLGTAHADRYLVEDGLWAHWTADHSVSDVPAYEYPRQCIEHMCGV